MDFSADTDTLQDGVADHVDDVGQVATHLLLDEDSGDNEREVRTSHSLIHFRKRLVQRFPQVCFAKNARKLRRHRRLHLFGNKLHGLQE